MQITMKLKLLGNNESSIYDMVKKQHVTKI